MDSAWFSDAGLADAVWQVSAKDYAVVVRGLPKDATEREIAQHFSKLYAINGQPTTPIHHPPTTHPACLYLPP